MDFFRWLWIPLVLVVVALSIASIRIYRDSRASKQALSKMLKSTAEAFSTGADDTRVSLYTVRNDGLLSLYSSSDSNYEFPTDFAIPMASGTAGQAWLKGMPISGSFTAADVHTWGATPQQREFAQPIRSELAVPLIDSKGKTLGVFTIDSSYPLKESRLGEEDRIRIAEEIAKMITSLLADPKRFDPNVIPSPPQDLG